MALSPNSMRGRLSFIAVVVLLAAAIALTMLARHFRTQHVERTAEAQREAAVSAAFEHIEAEFAAMQETQRKRAAALASHPTVTQALIGRMSGGEQESPALVRLFAALDLPERWSVELYDASLDIAAWSGFSLPPTGDAARRGLLAPSVAVAEDGDWRRALAVWQPVSAHGRLLGTVRVSQLILARTPVQNEVLKTYRVEDLWQRGIRLPVRTQFEMHHRLPDSVSALLLTGFDGSALGRVLVEPPTPVRLVELDRRRFDDVAAFWATLLLFWLLAGSWAWYRRAPGRRSAGIRLSTLAVGWWAARHLLLALGVPARWQLGKAPLNLLFDPTHLASTLGGGLMRSPGDLLLTALFALLFSLAALGHARRYYTAEGEDLPALWRRVLHTTRRAGMLVGLAATAAVSIGIALLLAVAAHHAVVDSTLEFFARDALIPPPLLLIVSCTLVIFALSVVLFIASLAWAVIGATAVGGRQEPRSAWIEGPLLLCAVAAPAAAVFLAFDLDRWLAWPVAAAFLGLGIALAIGGMLRTAGALQWLTLRSVLPAAFLVSVLLYPLVYDGMEERRRQRMEHASETFDRRYDPDVLFAVRDALASAVRHAPGASSPDSLAASLLRNSLLYSLGAYDASLVFLDSLGTPVGRFDVGAEVHGTPEVTARRFDLLRRMHPGGPDMVAEPMVGTRGPERFQYAGLVPVHGQDGGPAGWIMASAEPHLLLEDADTPLLRILVSSGDGGLYDDLSMAVFLDGRLAKTFGRRFGRYRLDESVAAGLDLQPALWRDERIKDRNYRTFYRREAPDTRSEGRVVAVRTPAMSTFDHLYYLLRLTVAGLLVGLPFYAVGLVMRRRAGLLPAPKVRFRDKVLNAFLLVGIFAVVTVGFVGVRVVTEENDRAIQSWLRQHLQRVEEALMLDARTGEMSHDVLRRTGLDSLAARVGLDLNLYRDGILVTASRTQLVRERLIGRRLPIQAHEALNLDGFKVTFVEDRLGRFGYTAGYWALFDETGRSRYILSVPTLPEQERIEEERARTLAYLFGALLALLMVVMATAALLASALARPIARLSHGLQAVAQGHFERLAPVGTRDEVGELVESFNDMQRQLVESRRQLTQQERQLAWREMARQVAHEIKNPLTPMKLSVQHLRRAYGDGESGRRFQQLFDRITSTLVEQIDSLAHIANEFASFARMPDRMAERVDCNDVIREAVSLMQEEVPVRIALRLHGEPIILEADREALRRTYINLIKNALEAIRDIERGSVSVSSAVDGGALYSTVEDTGTGIPPEVRKRIFEPNFSTKTSGTGLGLAIARRSVEAMGGTVGFETEPGRGTTFWIRVPLVE